MSNILIFFIISFINVFLHILRSILVIKSNKATASFWNCLCYTFSAVVVKFISDVDLYIAIFVQATTNYFGCYLGMLAYEKLEEMLKNTSNVKGNVKN